MEFPGFPVIGGKEAKHTLALVRLTCPGGRCPGKPHSAREGHQVHKGEKSLDFVGFPFVFESGFPVNNGRPNLSISA